MFRTRSRSTKCHRQHLRAGRSNRLLLEGLEDRCLLATLSFTQFSIPTPFANPASIAVGADRNLWFTESPDFTVGNGRGKIGRITPNGVITEFALPSGDGALSITAGPDGNLWFTEQTLPFASVAPDSIGRITTAGMITEFTLTSSATGDKIASNITAGPDGNLWVGVQGVNGAIGPPAVARITPNGTITEFQLSLADNKSSVTSITTGPDGNLWVLAGASVDAITPSGTVAKAFALASAFYSSIIAAPDGNLWFTGFTVNSMGKLNGEIVRITTAGNVTYFNLPSGVTAVDITTGPDGNLWFTVNSGSDSVAQITIGMEVPAGIVTLFQGPDNTAGAQLGGIVTGPDGNLWYVDAAPAQNEIIRIKVSNAGTDGGPNGRYVVQLYQVLLDRSPDPQGLAGFKNAVDSGQATQAQVAVDILNSPEFQTDEVTRLYQVTLNRSPDPAGLAGSVRFVAAGNSPIQLEAILLGSAEYFSDSGNTNAGFVAALYQTVLGRPEDSAGAQNFTQELASGVSRTIVTQQVLTSPEGDGVEVQYLYQTLVGRAADPTGLADGITLLENGGSPLQLALKLVTSVEFTNAVNGNANQLFVTQIYHGLLDRAADPGGLTVSAGLLDTGTLNRLQIVVSIQRSPEFLTDEVENLYQLVLGRPADPSGLGAWLGFLESGGTSSQLEAILLSSSEFFTVDGGSSNSAFLSALYQVVLHRAIDSTGAQVFGQALSNGVSLATVVAKVLNSAESQMLEVEGLYSQYLGRPADPGGLASALAELKQGGSLEQLAGVLIASPEYLSRL